MENDIMTWRCRGCGHATPCGVPNCARCGALRVVPSFGDLEEILARPAPDEEPMTEEEERAFMEIFRSTTEEEKWASIEAFRSTEVELAQDPGLARKFLTWVQAIFMAVCTAVVVVVGSLLGAAVLIGTMMKLKRR